MNEKNFYEKIGNWDFSTINYDSQRLSTWDMYKEIEKLTTKESVCLDLGTGGGEKVIKQYPTGAKIIATDYSEEMIKTAQINLENSKRKDIEFRVMNNVNPDLPNNSIDLVSARHTIINAKELYRILKPNGYVVIQGVDKEDCIEIKDIFKRGQAYNDTKAISTIDLENLKEAGFKIIKTETIKEIEHYKTKEDLLKLLLKTPILNDFSEETLEFKEYPIEPDLFERYVEIYSDDQGIILNRRLYGIIAKK